MYPERTPTNVGVSSTRILCSEHVSGRVFFEIARHLMSGVFGVQPENGSARGVSGRECPVTNDPRTQGNLKPQAQSLGSRRVPSDICCCAFVHTGRKSGRGLPQSKACGTRLRSRSVG
jgi:hypothetical protein